jgi:hypothetical protein
MKWLRKYLRKRSAFRAYRGKLRKMLLDKHGKTRNLNYQQVNLAINELNLDGEYESYAYAMALSESQYKHYQKISGVIYSQEALQIELGVSRELLKTQHFPTGGHGP